MFLILFNWVLNWEFFLIKERVYKLSYWSIDYGLNGKLKLKLFLIVESFIYLGERVRWERKFS